MDALDADLAGPCDPTSHVLAAGQARARLQRVARALRDTWLRTTLPELRAVPLWPHGSPDAIGYKREDRPTLAIYCPRNTPHVGSVVICPGGGYVRHAEHEASLVARWCTTLGLIAVVLRYRLAPRYRHPAALNDLQEALRRTREMPLGCGGPPGRVGVLGFSAGGHLAAMAAACGDVATAPASTQPEMPRERPDFAILVYPVITMLDPHAHAGCRLALTGGSQSEALLRRLSPETLVRPSAPPAFLVHGADDAVVSVQHSHLYAEACSAHRVPSALHVFRHGPHGFGLGRTHGEVRQWPDLCARWLADLGVLGPVKVG